MILVPILTTPMLRGRRQSVGSVGTSTLVIGNYCPLLSVPEFASSPKLYIRCYSVCRYVLACVYLRFVGSWRHEINIQLTQKKTLTPSFCWNGSGAKNRHARRHYWGRWGPLSSITFGRLGTVPSKGAPRAISFLFVAIKRSLFCKIRPPVNF